MITLDLVELVQVASAAGGRADPPADIVRSVDVDVLHLLGERARSAEDAIAAAAVLLVGIAASRPFPTDNGPAAWLAAAYVIESDGRRLVADPARALALVEDARIGRVEEALAAEALRSWARPTRRRQISGWATRPRGPRPEPCGRTGCVRCWQRANPASTTTPPGPAPASDSARWRPVVQPAHANDAGSIVVVTEVGHLPLRWTGAGYEVHRVRLLTAGELAASWQRVWARERPVAAVPVTAVELDAGGRLDLARLQEAIPSAALVPA